MALNYKEINFEEQIEAHLFNCRYFKRLLEEYEIIG